LVTAHEKNHLKYAVYFKVAFGRDAATAEIVKGLKSAIAKNLLSGDDKVSCTYIKDADSDWGCIRLHFPASSQKAIGFKKLMKS
jgi:hypothetical protein